MTGNPENRSLIPDGHTGKLEEWTLDAAGEAKEIYFIWNLFNCCLSNSASLASNDCLMVRYTGQAIVAVTV